MKGRLKCLLSVIPGFIMLALGGCQKTPETDLVKNKGEQNFEAALRETEGENSLDVFPEKLQEGFEMDGATIQIDAKLHIPDIREFVIDKVKPGIMPLEQVKEIIRYFVGNEPCYPLGSTGSREELLEMIIAMRQEISALESGVASTIDEGDGTKEEQLNILREQLKKHEELYADSSESSDKIAVDEVTFDQNDALELQCDLGRAEPARLLFYNDQDRGTQIEIMNYSPAYNSSEDGSDLKLSEEEAVSLVREELKKLGIDTLQILQVERENQVVDGRIIGYYNIYFQRELHGLSHLFFNEATALQSDLTEVQETEVYSAHMGQTKESVQVDDTGIIGIIFNQGPEIIETVNGNAALCDFDEFQSCLEENLRQKSWKAPGEKICLHITDIYLSSMYVIDKNDNQEYFTIPVWDFCGYAYTENTPESARYNLQKENQESIYKTTYLTMNAMDGSIVSRKSGY